MSILVWTEHEDELARQVGPVERHGEQEAQRRHRGANDGLTDTVFALVKLEAPHVLGGGGVGRAPEERRESAHVRT